MKFLDWKQVGLRAFHTAWQSFGAVLAVWWASSGADLAHHVTDVSSAERFAVAAGTAVVGAAASATKTTIAGLVSSRSLSAIIAQAGNGTGFIGDVPGYEADLEKLPSELEQKISDLIDARLGSTGAHAAPEPAPSPAATPPSA